jgi:hypothetical protein
MNFERRLKKLNKRLGDEFGWTPQGEPKFKWASTTEMYFWIFREEEIKKMDAASAILLPNGLYKPPEPKWECHAWADIHGPCWMLSTWKPSIPQEEWLAKYGPQVPWPKHGEYEFVENIRVPDGKDPDEDYTDMVIFAIRKHLEKDYEDHLRESNAIVAAQNKDTKRQWEDMVDDMAPAFNHIPGKCDGVVIGGIE